jgi:hypothetical protein
VTAPLTAVTPSTFHHLRQCGLRVAYDRAGPGGPRPSSPGARLGDAAHGVLARVARGEFGVDPTQPGFDAAVSTAWGQEVAAQASASRLHPVEATFGPPEAWPSFNDVASRLAYEAGTLAAQVHEWAGRALLVEQTIRPLGDTVWGTPDLIVGPGGGEGGTVIEFKSGAVGEEDTAPGGHMRDQVLLYAYLARKVGLDVERAEVRPIGRTPVAFQLDDVETSALLHEAAVLLAAFNEATAAGQALALGQPSDEACRWCPYADRCDALWAAPSAAPSLGLVGGVVEGVEDNGRGVAVVQLDADEGTGPLGHTIVTRLPLRRLVALHGLRSGDRIRFAGLRPDPVAPHLLRADSGGWVRAAPSGCH